jgi:hypothetical protein
MSMPAPGDQTTYVVTGQTERDQVQAAGPPVKGVTIFYQTGKGNQGSVWVSYADYNQGPDVVAPKLLAAASRMDQIGALSSGQ